LQERIEELHLKTELITLLANVRDFDRISKVCDLWRPRTIYHAAAYKHVSLVEQNPAEGINNNVYGTYNIARAAIESGALDCVLISTDKAVRPTNVMGATKRLAEMVFQALAASKSPAFSLGAAPSTRERINNTRFSMVRFGNVLGSSGSVVPIFREQIKAGGPITLTHSEVTRYFMIIPEAAQLVVQASAMSEGGDVFVLEMGPAIKIIDLAYRMVELSGLSVRDEANPNGDIEIKITGLRTGEKLYEELLIGKNPMPTAHPRIMKAQEDFIAWEELQLALSSLLLAVENNDTATIRSILMTLVNGYEPAANIVDWNHFARHGRVLVEKTNSASR
jgi:FlaA1/EpsC-like NDP-sugar epimerase